jgi:hypothetical protein
MRGTDGTFGVTFQLGFGTLRMRSIAARMRSVLVGC